MNKAPMSRKKDPDIQAYYKATRWDYRWVWGVRSTYALHYGVYDETATHHQAAVANKNRVMADMVGITSEDRVLDAGCGVGGSGIWLAAHRSCEVVGITPVEGQVRDARRNAARAKVGDKASFLVADYCRTPFEDHSFDVVWALESICHAPEKADFYREAFRLLRPGGRLAVADYFRLSRPLPNDGEQLIRQWLRPWAIPDIDSEAEHLGHARSAGFVDLEFRDITSQSMQSVINLWEHGTRWLWAAKLFHKLGIVSSIQVGNVEAVIYQCEAMNQGLWKMGLLSAHVPVGSPPK